MELHTSLPLGRQDNKTETPQTNPPPVIMTRVVTMQVRTVSSHTTEACICLPRHRVHVSFIKAADVTGKHTFASVWPVSLSNARFCRFYLTRFGRRYEVPGPA